LKNLILKHFVYMKGLAIRFFVMTATEEGYPVYKKVGFEDKTQKYLDMRLKL